MPGLSVIIPTYNEECNIEDALHSVSWASDILVVDSFSTDHTVELARKFTNHILLHEYLYPAAQKNWAIPQAIHEWILLLDADERVTPALRDEIQELLRDSPDKQAYWIFRENHFMKRKLRFGGFRRDKVIRLFRKEGCKYKDRFVHEEIIANGQVGTLKGKLLHFSYRDLNQYLIKVHRWAHLSAKDHHSSTGKLTPYHFIVKPVFKFFQFYFLNLGFLDGFPGLVYSMLAGYYVFLRYVWIWEIRHSKVD